MSPPINDLIIMTHSKLANGKTRTSKYKKAPVIMNAQRLPVVKSLPTSATSRMMRKATKPGEYKRIAKRICRVVKHLTESTLAAASSRPVPGLMDVAVAEGTFVVG